MPFALRELHTDNGSEFINHSLRGWCIQQGIRLTRGRGYRKNDQAYVEQRNWLAVRRLVGYQRYNSKPAYEALVHLYRLLRLQMNYFRPVRKLVGKERHGARTSKRYDAPCTPYQRLLGSGLLSRPSRERLEQQFLTINPADLQRRIEQSLHDLWSYTAQHQRAQVG